MDWKSAMEREGNAQYLEIKHPSAYREGSKGILKIFELNEGKIQLVKMCEIWCKLGFEKKF